MIRALILSLGVLCCTLESAAEEIRCYKTSPETTICKDSKGNIVKTLVEGKDGTITLTTKQGTKRCFTINGEIICR